MDHKERLLIGPGGMEPGPDAAWAEVKRLQAELEQARASLAQAEATEKQLTEQAQNLHLIDSLTLDDWSEAHQQLASEIEQAGFNRQRLSVNCRRAEDQLTAAELAWAELAAADDFPVDLAA